MTQKQPVVIIVDDEESVRMLIRLMLEKQGMTFFEAADGNECLLIAAAHTPDLVITDLIMPEKEGIETICEIRSLFPDCGIIAISGATRSENYLTISTLLGAHCALKKPFTQTELFEAVRESMEQTERAAAAPLHPAGTAFKQLDRR